MVKNIGQEPRTQKGRDSLIILNDGRLTEGLRGDLGGGKPSGISSATAELDWLPTYFKRWFIKTKLLI